MTPALTILTGDACEQLATLPDESVNCCVTSPPYWGLRDYGEAGQIGLEPTPQEYVTRLVRVFEEVRRVLGKDGVCWVNLGDSYNGYNVNRGDSRSISANVNGEVPAAAVGLSCQALPNKSLIGIPWRVAFALQDAGWILRQDIIWHKPNPMPESVTDRCTKAHEYVFMLTKSPRYWWDAEAMREEGVWPAGTKGAKGSAARHSANGVNSRPPEYKIYDGTRNRRSVWTITTQPYSDAHFATFPEELPRFCITASCPPGGTVLDPFGGSGTTGKVALENGRNAVLVELNPKYVEMIRRRCNVTPGFAFKP